MNIELIVSILMAIGGWGFAFYQKKKNREWQKKDLLANRRFDAYSGFMRKLEEINENFRKNPNAIYGVTNEFLSSIMKGSVEEMNDALMKLNQRLNEYVKVSVEPLMIVNQEISPLLLIASEELTAKLNRLKDLTADFNNEMQNCMSKINVKDSNSFRVFETIGHDKRWEDFKVLNDEIMCLMRKELEIK